jgi:hypothetical protein
MRGWRPVVLIVLCMAVVGAAGRARADDDPSQVFKETCGACHNAETRPLDAVRLSREKWKEAVERMEGLGADVPSGKKLSTLLDWLAKTHGPTGEGAAPAEKK